MAQIGQILGEIWSREQAVAWRVLLERHMSLGGFQQRQLVLSHYMSGHEAFLEVPLSYLEPIPLAIPKLHSSPCQSP